MYIISLKYVRLHVPCQPHVRAYKIYKENYNSPRNEKKKIREGLNYFVIICILLIYDCNKLEISMHFHLLLSS